MDVKPATLQDIFDAAWHHFMVGQAPPAIGEDGVCCYLTKDGNKCAVGLVLPEGHRSQTMGCGFAELVKDYPELWDKQIRKLAKQDRARLGEFQADLHDYHTDDHGWVTPLEERKAAYLKVAADYGLTVPASE
jgi:hypothetical protein